MIDVIALEADVLVEIRGKHLQAAKNFARLLGWVGRIVASASREFWEWDQKRFGKLNVQLLFCPLPHKFREFACTGKRFIGRRQMKIQPFRVQLECQAHDCISNIVDRDDIHPEIGIGR